MVRKNHAKRRTVLKSIGAGTTLSAINIIGSATATQYREYRLIGNCPDGSTDINYEVEFNSQDINTRKLESNEYTYEWGSDWRCQGTLRDDGEDIFEIPQDAAMTGLEVEGDTDDWVSVNADIEERGYGEQVMLFSANNNSGEYSGMTKGRWLAEGRTEWPSDNAECTSTNTCALSGEIADGGYDRWRLEGDSPFTFTVNVSRGGGSVSMAVTDSVSP